MSINNPNYDYEKNSLNIKVGDFVVNKGEAEKGLSTMLYRIDKVCERDAYKYDEEKEDYVVVGREILVEGWNPDNHHTCSFVIKVWDPKREYAIITAETMKVLCA